MTFANIVSTGMYLPDIEVTNQMLAEKFDKLIPEFVQKMEASSGILRRWNAPEDWATSDLAARAAKQALERAGTKRRRSPRRTCRRSSPRSCPARWWKWPA